MFTLTMAASSLPVDDGRPVILWPSTESLPQNLPLPLQRRGCSDLWQCFFHHKFKSRAFAHLHSVAVPQLDTGAEGTLWSNFDRNAGNVGRRWHRWNQGVGIGGCWLGQACRECFHFPSASP
jgi:hypothetical protein